MTCSRGCEPGHNRCVPDDRLAEAVAELYSGTPEAFTGRRAQLTAAARDAGDREAAKAIGALRRPTRAAWVVNHLSRVDPGAPLRLAELGGALRAAQRAGHGPRLRELSAARGALVDALTAQALTLAEVGDPPPALRLEVAETLSAALADPAVAADFSAARLTRAAQWSGFGELPEGLVPEDGNDAAPDGDANARPARAGTGRTARPSAGKTARGQPVDGQRQAEAAELRAREAAELRAREAAEPRAREAAERATRRREQQEEAERVLAAASAATAEAESAEDRLEAAVRDLEQQLVQARSDLSAARTRARHAEASERRAQQALDRLPGAER